MYDKFRSIIKSGHFKIVFWCSLLALVLIIAFRVPARLVAHNIDQNSDLPVDVLALSRDVDWSAYEVEYGFGMRSYYLTQPDGAMLRFDVSRWPGAFWGKPRVDYVVCTDLSYSVFGFSVGDPLSFAKETLRKHGFIITEDASDRGFQCRKFSVIISCWSDEKTGKIKEITIHVPGTNIIPIVY